MAVNPIMPHTPSLDMAAKTQAQAAQKVSEAAPLKADEITGAKDSASADPKRFDTFEKGGENSASEAAGIYRMGEDENGNPKILFKNPEQTDKSAAEPSNPENAPKNERDKETKDTKCTVNTDKVDAEIKELQKEEQEIQRQLQSEENADKREKLEQQLQNLETELHAKDNDAYRKQHAAYTMG